MRVILFGNDYHPMALACLEGLAAAGRYELFVGVCVPESGGLLRTARNAWRDYGATFVVRRATDLVRARLGGSLRRLTRARRGFASLREAARSLDLPCLDVSTLGQPETVARVKDVAPDLILVAGFSRIIREEVFSIPPAGCVNLHTSLLPKYRGPNPVFWVLREGESTTGVTLHYVDAGIDSGPIIAQREVPIRPGDTERALFRRCISAGVQLVEAELPRFEDGRVDAVPQDESRATYYSHPPRGASAL